MIRVSNRPDSSVEVVAYSADWPARFDEERAELSAALVPVARSIEHIGSTAVPGLSAKPTIDILVVVDSTRAFLDRLEAIEALGYDYRSENTLVGSGEHLFLRKVSAGKRTHHLHVLVVGSPEIDEYRWFRDALRDDDELRREYEAFKVVLAATHRDDRMAYVKEKALWVERLVARLRSDRQRP